MSRWFRFYADAMRHPKVAELSDREFRWWVNMLAVAAENDGVIPPEESLKRLLNARLDHVLTAVKRLLKGGLIDRCDGGYTPHNWNKRQYKSDTSTDRVRKHRAERNVSETPPDTETDTETEKKKDSADAASAYAFAGKVIKLTIKDFGQWQSSFHHLDLASELQSRDDWLATEADERTRAKWFISTSNWLASRNRLGAQPTVPI